MRFRTLGLWATFAILLLPLTSLAGPPPKIYIQDIRPEAGIDEKVARSLSDLLELEIERGGIFTVVSQQDVRRLLNLESQRLLIGTETDDDLKRMAAIAKNLDAPYALASSIGKVGSTYVLSLRLIDVQEVKVIRRISQTLVGDEQGLIGSLRAAALGLNLEQKGLSPDISEQLIEKLKIAEKEKKIFMSFSPAYEISLPGLGAEDSSSILTLRPAYLHMRLDAEMPIWRYLRIFGSISVGFTLSPTEKQEVNNTSRITDPALENPAINFSGLVADINYSSLRIPFSLGVKIAPETGRFLPYGLLGVGISWQQFSFADSQMGLFREAPEEGGCQSPFSESSFENTIPICSIDGIPLEAQSNLDSLGFDVVAAAGAEWLLNQHIGVKFEARYNFTLLFKDAPDTYVHFDGQFSEGDSVLETRYASAIQHIHHGLMFSAGVVAYW